MILLLFFWYNIIDMDKICTKCKQLKSLKEFGKCKSFKDGYAYWCKQCFKQWRQYNPEYHKQWCRDNPEKIKQHDKQYHQNNPKKYKQFRYNYLRSISGRYKSAQRIALTRQINWNISKEDYNVLIVQKCYYCNGKLSETGSGLDRKDNNIGYLASNVVPCCKYCNMIKNNYLTFEEMLKLKPFLIEFRAKRER
jgi:hypothetical protein